MPHHVECSQWLGIAWEGTGRWRIWMWMQRWRCLSVVHRRQKRHKSSATSALANENFVAFCISEVATRRSKMQSSISHVENNSGTKYEKRTQTGRRELKNTTEEAHVTLHTVRVCGGNGWGVGWKCWKNWEETAKGSNWLDRRHRHESGK